MRRAGITLVLVAVAGCGGNRRAVPLRALSRASAIVLTQPPRGAASLRTPAGTLRVWNGQGDRCVAVFRRGGESVASCTRSALAVARTRLGALLYDTHFFAQIVPTAHGPRPARLAPRAPPGVRHQVPATAARLIHGHPHPSGLVIVTGPEHTGAPVAPQHARRVGASRRLR